MPLYISIENHDVALHNCLVDTDAKNNIIPLMVMETFVTREKFSMAKGKPQQTGMTAEINSIPTYAI